MTITNAKKDSYLTQIPNITVKNYPEIHSIQFHPLDISLRVPMSEI